MGAKEVDELLMETSKDVEKQFKAEGLLSGWTTVCDFQGWFQ